MQLHGLQSWVGAAGAITGEVRPGGRESAATLQLGVGLEQFDVGLNLDWDASEGVESKFNAE